jgi:hypothetical protein
MMSNFEKKKKIFLKKLYFGKKSFVLDFRRKKICSLFLKCRDLLRIFGTSINYIVLI